MERARTASVLSVPHPRPGLLSKYLRVWRRLAVMSFAVQLTNRLASGGYLVGKFVRLGFFIIFLMALFDHTPRLARYTMFEVLLFFLTFNLIDILAQMLFRGIYGVRGLVREGDLDYFLAQPMNPLFRIAANTFDFLDLATLGPVIAVLTVIIAKLPQSVSAMQVLLYLALCLNGTLIALAIHIVVAAIAVATQELDNTIWLYRDLMTLGRFPVDIYTTPLRWVLTGIVPIAVMISFPAQALLGLLAWPKLLYAAGISTLALCLSLRLWRRSLRHYTSVSS